MRPTMSVLATALACAAACASKSGTDRQSVSAVAALPPAERCAALASAPSSAWVDPTTVIASATLRADHCEVLGHLRDRVGANGQHYAINFHLRLPIAWNGRFLFQGGGGSDGVVGDAMGTIGPGLPTAFQRGFAVLSQDSGHDDRTNADPARQGTLAFAYDPQARRDLAYASLEVTARTGVAIVRAFYGRPPERSYFYGCSEGGREGMVFAQRFPQLFDGIVAAAPGFALPKAAIAEAWDTRAFADLARRAGLVDSSGTPVLARTFSDADLALVADAVLAACDAADGAADGIVGDYRACTPDRVAPVLAERICRDASSTGCLSIDQVSTLRRVLGGPRSSTGESLYSDWAWDAGIGGRVGDRYHQGWRMWKIGGYPPSTIPSLNVVLGGASLSALFTTPPTVVPNDPHALLAYLTTFDMDRDAPKILARSGAFTESSWELIGAKSTDLSAFRRRGGKLIVPHGLSDPVFSANDTMRWWDAVNAASGGHASDFVRVFPVPGMAHCGGGPATDRYDCLTAVMAWVERGIAPDRIVATAGPGSPWPGRTRPLCPYPTVARYSGAGSIEDAGSFVCR